MIETHCPSVNPFFFFLTQIIAASVADPLLQPITCIFVNYLPEGSSPEKVFPDVPSFFCHFVFERSLRTFGVKMFFFSFLLCFETVQTRHLICSESMALVKSGLEVSMI